MPAHVRDVLADTNNDLFVSIASVWEIGIKVASGKLTINSPIESLIQKELQADNILVLPIQINHVAEMMRLPYHHRDPFDRLLIGQCVAEDLLLVCSSGL